MKGTRKQEVFLLWHDHRFENGSHDELLVGVYRSEQQAKTDIERLRVKPGFADRPDAFSISMYELDKCYWPEGYTADECESDTSGTWIM